MPSVTRIGPRRPHTIHLRAWRKYFGLTLESLADRLNQNTGANTSKGTVSRWETGERGFDDGILQAIAEVYGRGMTAERLKHPPPLIGHPLPWETASEGIPPKGDDLEAIAAQLVQIARANRG